ncbi:MAG: thiolase family protein, partial [Candidatus Lokiarchaeota archaeon]|nr:thiolase family protein [Candidatus Lokiarchaeota archaeon]
MHRIAIVNGARTPIGRFGKTLRDIPAVDLGSIAIKAAIRRSCIDPRSIDNVIFGAIHQEGMGNNPTRIASLKSGIPYTSGALTVNNVCSSGMKAIEIAAHRIMLGMDEIVIAGGMESNSQCPYMVLNARWGLRLGNQQMVDALYYDGFKDIYGMYGKYQHVGETAENILENIDILRQEYNLPSFSLNFEEINEFAFKSHQKYFKAKSEGFFKEITPVKYDLKGKTITLFDDESPRKDLTIENLNHMNPLFRKNGKVTAGNVTNLNDGACALVLMSEHKCQELGLNPLGYWINSSEGNVNPKFMGIGPIIAIRNLLNKEGLHRDQIDLYEINEAQAQQVLFCVKALELDLKKVNVNGGSIAMGHPPGMTGARLILTALYELRRKERNLAICSQCAGGGTGMATLIKKASSS